MKDTFGKRPRIRSFAQLGKATGLVVALQKQRDAAQAELDAELEAVRRKHARKFRTIVDGESISIDERIDQLQSAITSFTSKQRDSLPFRKGTKTIDTAGGAVHLRDEAGFIDFVPGMNRRLAAAQLVQVDGWQMAVNQLLDDFGLLGWIVLIPDLDWDSLKRGLRNGSITPEDIAEYGMTWNKPVKTRVSRK